MKNNKLFLGILIGILFSSISVYAATKYLAKDITYKDTNVENALNELYNKSKTHIYETGEFNQYVTSYGDYVTVKIDLSRTYTEEDNAKLIITSITNPNAIYYNSQAVTNKIIGNSISIVLLNYAYADAYNKTYNVKYSIVKIED